MNRAIMKRWLVMVVLVALAVPFQSACLLHRHKLDLAGLGPGDQPDKILYEKAVESIRRGRYDVGRLTLQTLLNTYPDSEYLAKAKLAIADSYYQQGGVSGLTQAEAEYKDFITFFPTAPEAPESQYRAGMCHFRLMGKPDRDLTETKLAEAEFKEFLLRYPDSPLLPQVQGRLRQVQEVLAEGNFRVAQFYFEHHANRAAESRFKEISEDYPNFSRADEANWDLAETLKRLRKPNESAPYYARILTQYPLSPLVPQAKQQLAAMHLPIPSPTKAVLARAHADAVNRHPRSMLEKFAGVFSSRPDMSATRHGPVVLGKPRPYEAVMAEATPAAPSPGNSIVAQPVSESSLGAGKVVEPKPKAEANGQNSKPGASGTEATDPKAQPEKKKGHFHFIKKLFPF
jgi:outer membrane protein assembly factor BamD